MPIWIAIVLAGWFTLSIALGLLIGCWIRRGREQEWWR